ncbi:MAG: YafY family transcriptional regulator [Clostridia bacterium]|nr:YafY family transcriptional regulator [Clostridia bacterium]
MKYQIMIKMLMLLTSRRKVTAKEFAEKFDISIRSVYRYVDELNVAGVPVDVVRGRYGGIYISDTFKLPSGFFTRGEYAACVNALNAMSENLKDGDILSALEKLQRQQKSDRRELSVCGNIIVDGGSWADLGKFPQKMQVCEKAVNESLCMEIDYLSREGEHSRRVIDPHVLIFKQNVWYLFAFCHNRQDFRTFKIGRIRSAHFTGRTFTKRAVTKEDIPLNFEYTSEQLIPVTLQIKKDAAADVEEWLGVDNVEPRGEGLIATVSLPDDDTLVDKILGFGGKVKVLSPLSLQERVRAAAYSIYSD